MDCCGSSKPEENEKETKTDKMRSENMMNGAKDCSVMMYESTPSDNAEAEDREHCGDTGSMMSSKGADMKSMM